MLPGIADRYYPNTYLYQLPYATNSYQSKLPVAIRHRLSHILFLAQGTGHRSPGRLLVKAGDIYVPGFWQAAY
jgi:hypothetical protein